MSPALHAAERLPRRLAGDARVPRRRRLAGVVERLAEGFVFAGTVVRFLVLILPQVRRERARWRSRARAIPSEGLREIAQVALAKRGNIEGAALFAVLAERAHRRDAVRSLVAFQAAYNYLDALSELPSVDPQANARQLHRAVLSAVEPDGEHVDYYAHNPEGEDGGYLAELVDACREGCSGLPGYRSLAPAMSLAAARIADFQTLNLSEAQGGQPGLEPWASAMAQPGFAWWESAAGAGSSLALHALVATAARGDVDASATESIERAYFPTIGALHSLLDSLVDRQEDRDKGQLSLLAHYRSPRQAGERIAGLAAQARRACAAGTLPAHRSHLAILTAMCSYYLSAPQCRDEQAREARAYLLDALGLRLRVAILLFGVRRLLARLAGDGYT